MQKPLQFYFINNSNYKKNVFTQFKRPTIQIYRYEILAVGQIMC